MKGITRRNTLREAKTKIETELRAAWTLAHAAYIEELNKEDRCDDHLDNLFEVMESAAKAFQDWKKSKKRKKKESIQWAQDIEGNVASKPKKKAREIKDWDALREIRNNHRSSRPRAGAWLQEGGMVVQRGSSMPMMVLSIRDSGAVEVLSAGSTKFVRDVSLRPAFDEE